MFDMRKMAVEGHATVTAEIVPGYDRNRALQEVTSAVHRISMFPNDAELPRISLGDGRRRSVLTIAVYGELDERTRQFTALGRHHAVEGQLGRLSGTPASRCPSG